MKKASVFTARMLVSGLLVYALANAATAAPLWDSYGDVSVIWNKSRGLSKVRFHDDVSDCAQRPVDQVRVLSQSLYTENNADDLFRGRGSNGRVSSYRIPANDAPRVVYSWFEDMLEEGKTVRVSSVVCGNGGYIYVTQLEAVARKRGR